MSNIEGEPASEDHICTSGIGRELSTTSEDVKTKQQDQHRLTEEYNRTKAALAKEKRRFQILTERRTTEQALFNQNASGIDRMFSTTKTGWYRLQGRAGCCLDAAVADAEEADRLPASPRLADVLAVYAKTKAPLKYVLKADEDSKKSVEFVDASLLLLSLSVQQDEQMELQDVSKEIAKQIADLESQEGRETEAQNTRSEEVAGEIDTLDAPDPKIQQEHVSQAVKDSTSEQTLRRVFATYGMSAEHLIDNLSLTWDEETESPAGNPDLHLAERIQRQTFDAIRMTQLIAESRGWDATAEWARQGLKDCGFKEGQDGHFPDYWDGSGSDEGDSQVNGGGRDAKGVEVTVTPVVDEREIRQR